MKDALDVGYRHFDTAQIYNTEECVGKVIKDTIQKGTLRREDLFITTKVCALSCWTSEMLTCVSIHGDSP